MTTVYVDAVRDEVQLRILPAIASNITLDALPDEHDLTILGATSAVREHCLGVL